MTVDLIILYVVASFLTAGYAYNTATGDSFDRGASFVVAFLLMPVWWASVLSIKATKRFRR